MGSALLECDEGSDALAELRLVLRSVRERIVRQIAAPARAG